MLRYISKCDEYYKEFVLSIGKNNLQILAITDDLIENLRKIKLDTMVNGQKKIISHELEEELALKMKNRRGKW